MNKIKKLVLLISILLIIGLLSSGCSLITPMPETSIIIDTDSNLGMSTNTGYENSDF